MARDVVPPFAPSGEFSLASSPLQRPRQGGGTCLTIFFPTSLPRVKNLFLNPILSSFLNPSQPSLERWVQTKLPDPGDQDMRTSLAWCLIIPSHKRVTPETEFQGEPTPQAGKGVQRVMSVGSSLDSPVSDPAGVGGGGRGPAHTNGQRFVARLQLRRRVCARARLAIVA
jgi:hypothetical protein